ncbi:helix-turn-helix domain-containing protein [Flavobacteriaceae bacterium]|nr:helix-turn-helix domain-containing protein [Flavobacteriaceae bacterium]MDA9323222.1 helix-turn-helix domain-containing protein [Flavobacteriaceae bacterium]MDC6456676.1 hypothetical protein [Flavobacteriaceae bacterium]
MGQSRYLIALCNNRVLQLGVFCFFDTSHPNYFYSLVGQKPNSYANTIDAIGNMAGYQSKSAFYKAFKEHHGRTTGVPAK